MSMNEDVLSYKVKLTVQTPTFVGSGQQYTKLDYVPKGDMIAVLDTDKFFDKLIRINAVNTFEGYIIHNNRPSLKEFLRDNSYIERNAADCFSYKIRVSKAPSGNVACFMRNTEGKPYIPGSSIKGALRTVIITAMLESSPNKKASFKNDGYVEYDEGQKEDIEKYYSNSILNGISISDATPVDNSNLMICQKIDIESVKGNEKEMPGVFRECLMPKTEMTFVLTINRRRMRGNFAKLYSKDHIKKAISKFDDYYNKTYISKFNNLNMKKPDLTDSIILGGGSGYFSKNIMYPLYGYDEALMKVSEQMKKKFKYHHHEFDKENGISPHRLKYARDNSGNLMHMGICKIKIEDEPICV